MSHLRPLLAALDDRVLVDAVFGDHPAADPTRPAIEVFTSHGCAVLAQALAGLTGRPVLVAWLDGEPLHAVVRAGDRYLDADGLHERDELVAAWAAIADAEPAAIELRPWDDGAARHFAPSLAGGEIERLAAALAGRVPAAVAALRA